MVTVVESPHPPEKTAQPSDAVVTSPELLASHESLCLSFLTHQMG